MTQSTMNAPQFKEIECSIASDHVGLLTLNRPHKSNSMNEQLWRELPEGLQYLQRAGARCIILNGSGKNFCAGLDTDSLATLQQNPSATPATHRYNFTLFVKQLQDSVTACEQCTCPVIAAVHGACIGAGIDLITACDIRYSTADALFCVKEVDLGITADMGTLSRLPGIVGDGIARDIALTARTFTGQEAKEMHLVSKTFPDQVSLMAAVGKIAAEIAAKPPIAVAGTKKMLLYQRDHTIEDGLNMVATFNAAVLPGSEEIREVFTAMKERRKPVFTSSTTTANVSKL